jgi:hypothetical protein
VLLTLPDTPLIDIGSVGLYKFKERLDNHPSALFVRALTLKDWGGPDESPFTRTRDFIFRFGVSYIANDPAGNPDRAFRAQAHCRAVQDTTPLLHFVPRSGEPGSGTGDDCRFLDVTPDTIEVLTMKPAESGRGWIIRLREVTGVPTVARLSFPALSIVACRAAMMTEELGLPVPFTAEEVSVPCAPFAIVTLFLELVPRTRHV